jgi:hypothetical protein
MVLENVRGLQKFLGRAVAHYGSYYLWGDVPLLLPIGRPEKGLLLRRGTNGRRVGQGPNRYGSQSPKRKMWSATAAMVPIELSRFIGSCFK